MSARVETEFRELLEDLFDDRMSWLRRRIWVHPGKPPTVTRTKVDQTITKLQELATIPLLRSKSAQAAFAEYDYKRQWHPKRGKAFRWTAKRKEFKDWYEVKIPTKNCVYVFWNNKRCLYIGRTINGHGRPTHHFQKYWARKTTRIDVYGFERKRGVPRFECMMTHRHEPLESVHTPASKRYYTQCPVCVVYDDIRDQVKQVFRLK